MNRSAGLKPLCNGDPGAIAAHHPDPHTTMHLLLAEDDQQLAASLVEILATQRYCIDVVNDGEQAWHSVQSSQYDLLLLDLTLPKLDGLSLCRRLRASGYQFPIMMLTARDTTEDKILGLDAGADVYMVKPFAVQEVQAQLRALLRRGLAPLPPSLAWGAVSLNPQTYEVHYRDRPIHLTPKEFAILDLLLRHRPQVVNRDRLRHSLWSVTDYPSDATIKVHIKSLRQKLRAAGAPRDWLQTVHGVGYRLNSTPP
ncbi:response regulator transcription factor [Spirulina major CS-329]|uniref:response regulator n=1 Tax=Spirulina TaxID=1154 RepID=UPI00232F72D7|nr:MULTISPECIES: response regulator transcription factor [Spirulina]MDB9496247.1 response regulator transcription factor [Spirulina subsalsa CS-330]MDB9502264.1 response regulator transcription factor [Spirulina major CS-329]